MRLLIPSQSSQQVGGGFTFRRNITKWLPMVDESIEVVADGVSDAVLICGATMVQRRTVEEWKDEGRKVILRVDNAPRDSRNRNTGASRLRDFAAMADLVIYQSEWARDFLLPFTKADGPVILNGADHEIYNRDVIGRPPDGSPQYLYVRYNRDESKNWHQAWHQYVMVCRREPNAHLWIVGRFSEELRNARFDFFMGERHEYCGIVDDMRQMAEIYRGADVLLAPYFNDASSNVVVEYRLCGAGHISHNGTGGTPELLAAPIEQVTAQYMAKRYAEEICRL